MAPLSIIRALTALPLALAHMQMSDPSPINDPHQTPLRPGETLDYNYLNPLNADGSNFACKGYHLNTPLNTVATFEAGSQQTLRLRGSTTHGGGSCQISLSCDGGSTFNVMKSIMGGCPLSDSYDFRVPSDIPPAKKCLLAWTWFNRIGNREMYMNCAVVDITNKSQNKAKRDTQASAATALASYPELFVANLANINNCKIQETTDVIFDNPGKEVVFGNGDGASMKPSFKRGQCTAKSGNKAGSKAPAPSYFGGGGGAGGSSGGDDGHWNPPKQGTGGASGNDKSNSPKQSTSSSNGCTAAMMSSGKWYPACFGRNSRAVQQEQQPAQQQEQQQTQKPKQDAPKSSTQESNQKKLNTNVQQQLDAYLSTLGGSRLARRNTAPAADYSEEYGQKDEPPAQPYEHIHTADCKKKTPEYPPGSHYHNTDDLDPYPKDGTDHFNKNVYSTQDSHYHEDPQSAYKRISRQKRWTAYSKRQEAARKTPINFYRGDESAYYQQQAAAQAQAQPQTLAQPAEQASDEQTQSVADAPTQSSTDASTQSVTDAPTQSSTDASTQSSTDASTQSSTDASTQASAQPPAQKSYSAMTDQEKLEAFLRRMVELSTNMASLIKYATTSSQAPSIPYYPAASTYDGTKAPDAQNAAAVRRHARRGLLSSTGSPAQVYPGPAVGTISAPGEATDAEEGLRTWFPHLVQGPMTKRQLVDPVTSEASAKSGDGVNFFDALLADFWKLFDNPFNLSGDIPETDPVPAPDSPDADSSGIPLVLGEPDSSSSQPDFPDFDIPDLDGSYLPPPEVYYNPPAPELLPGYVLGPDGPVWVGEGPDPLADDSSESEPTIIISIDPVDPTSDFFPGEDVPTLSCIEPIPQVGFNSCLGGCNHTAEAIASHETYLQNFAAEQAAYEECLQNQALDDLSPPAGIFPNLDGDGDDDNMNTAAEDASGRRPRPGMSHPLIPYPLPDNFTGPYPSNSSNTASSAHVSAPSATATTSASTEPARVGLQLYQNKTLGELVSDILRHPAVLDHALAGDPAISDPEENPIAPALPDPAPLPSNSTDTPPQVDTNALQEAVDQAENGITAPSDAAPASINPNTLDNIADALPWLLEPGPVTEPNALETIAHALPWHMGHGPVIVHPPAAADAQASV